MDSDDFFKEEKFSLVKSILGLTAFSTILPIKTHTSIKYMTRVVWIWPLIHFVIGIVAAGIGFVCLNLLHFNTLFSAILVFAFLILISGFNHMDGIMDMADGLMVHGTSFKRIEVMKDSMVGAGGITAAILLSLVTVGGIENVLCYNFVLGIIVIEMVSKTSLLTTALVSKPFNQGIGKFFIESTNPLNFVISTVIVAIISYLLCGFAGLFALLGAIFAGGIIAYIARERFTVANGDVLGASNEFGRAMALIFMLIGLYYLM